MDHIVFLDHEANELENLVMGNKSMIIRGAADRTIPFGKVSKGDILFLTESRGENIVTASGIVTTVINSGELSCEESYETIIRHQDRLQLPDKQFESIAGSKYLVLIGLTGIRKIEPFRFPKHKLAPENDWISVGNIETFHTA